MNEWNEVAYTPYILKHDLWFGSHYREIMFLLSTVPEGEGISTRFLKRIKGGY